MLFDVEVFVTGTLTHKTSSMVSMTVSRVDVFKIRPNCFVLIFCRTSYVISFSKYAKLFLVCLTLTFSGFSERKGNALWNIDT